MMLCSTAVIYMNKRFCFNDMYLYVIIVCYLFKENYKSGVGHAWWIILYIIIN